MEFGESPSTSGSNSASKNTAARASGFRESMSVFLTNRTEQSSKKILIEETRVYNESKRLDMEDKREAKKLELEEKRDAKKLELEEKRLELEAKHREADAKRSQTMMELLIKLVADRQPAL